MSVEENKSNQRRVFEEVINKGNLAIIPDLIAPEYVFRSPLGVEAKGPESFKQMIVMFRTAFPDIHFTIDDILGEGDRVSLRFTMTGTFTGEMMGIAPTGKKARYSAILMTKWAGGKEVQAWEAMDTAPFFQQLGIAPPVFGQTEDKNKTAIRRIVDEMWNRRNLALIPELYDPSYVFHASEQDIKGRDGLKQTVTMALNAFPDLTMTLDDIVAEGDKVAWRYTVTGTHKGLYLGIAPTGKKMKSSTTIISRCVNGKEAEAWPASDRLSMYEQLGVKPPTR